MTDDRFWNRVDANGPCWLWLGHTNGHGYAQVKIGGRAIYVHRHAWELLVGPIPQGMELDHLCRVRHCVNPDHLEVVTHAENMRRASWTHCRRGHLFVNPIINSSGRRMCRICVYASNQRSRERARS